MLPAGHRRQPKARLPVAIQSGCIPTNFPAILSLHLWLAGTRSGRSYQLAGLRLAINASAARPRGVSRNDRYWPIVWKTRKMTGRENLDFARGTFFCRSNCHDESHGRATRSKIARRPNPAEFSFKAVYGSLNCDRHEKTTFPTQSAHCRSSLRACTSEIPDGHGSGNSTQIFAFALNDVSPKICRAPVVVEGATVRPFVAENTTMIVIGLILCVFGVGFVCWLLFTRVGAGASKAGQRVPIQLLRHVLLGSRQPLHFRAQIEPARF